MQRRAALGRCHVDVGFWSAWCLPEMPRDIAPSRRAGVKVQVFPESLRRRRIPSRQRTDLAEAMPIVASTGLAAAGARRVGRRCCGSPTHAPTRAVIRPGSQPPTTANRRRSSLVIDLAVGQGRACTSSSAPPAMRSSSIGGRRAKGIPLTVETCPHYLTFGAEVSWTRHGAESAPPFGKRASRRTLARSRPG